MRVKAISWKLKVIVRWSWHGPCLSVGEPERLPTKVGNSFRRGTHMLQLGQILSAAGYGNPSIAKPTTEDWRVRAGSNGEHYIESPASEVGDVAARVVIRVGRSARSRTDASMTIKATGVGFGFPGLTLTLAQLASIDGVAKAAKLAFDTYGLDDSGIPDAIAREAGITVPAAGNGKRK